MRVKLKTEDELKAEFPVYEDDDGDLYISDYDDLYIDNGNNPFQILRHERKYLGTVVDVKENSGYSDYTHYLNEAHNDRKVLLHKSWFKYVNLEKEIERNLFILRYVLLAMRKHRDRSTIIDEVKKFNHDITDDEIEKILNMKIEDMLL